MHLVLGSTAPTQEKYNLGLTCIVNLILGSHMLMSRAVWRIGGIAHAAAESITITIHLNLPQKLEVIKTAREM